MIANHKRTGAIATGQLQRSLSPGDALLAMVHEGVDFTNRQLGVLVTLGRQRTPGTVRDLAATLDVSKPAITRASDRLVEAGLVFRSPDPEDRRSVHLRLTPSGRRFLTDRLGEPL